MNTSLNRDMLRDYILRISMYWAALHEQCLENFLHSGAMANELSCTQEPGFPQTFRVL